MKPSNAEETKVVLLGFILHFFGLVVRDK